MTEIEKANLKHTKAQTRLVNAQAANLEAQTKANYGRKPADAKKAGK